MSQQSTSFLGRSGLLGEYEDPLSRNTIAVKCHGFSGLVEPKRQAKGVILLVSKFASFYAIQKASLLLRINFR